MKTIFAHPAPTEDQALKQKLLDEIAELRSEVRALRTERDSTDERNRLKRQVEDLKIEKARLVEDNDRKIRETEHNVGLLKIQQKHDVDNAKRETMVQVREENLAKDQERFEDQMNFQRTQLQGEIHRVERILEQVLERLPNFDATVTAALGPSRGKRGNEDS